MAGDRGPLHSARTGSAGTSPAAKRIDLMNALNTGRIKVLIGQNKALMTGANLQERANAVVHLDTPWEPLVLAQSTARVYRQGQKHITSIFRAVGSDIEQSIERTVLDKIRQGEAAFGKESTGEGGFKETLKDRPPVSVEDLKKFFGLTDDDFAGAPGDLEEDEEA